MTCWIELGGLSAMLALITAMGWRAALMVARSRRWVRASATVCDAKGSAVPNDRAPQGWLYASFTGPEGRTVVAPLTYLSEDPPRIGERVHIAYDPDDPTRADPYVGVAGGLAYLSLAAVVGAAAAWGLVQRIAGGG